LEYLLDLDSRDLWLSKLALLADRAANRLAARELGSDNQFLAPINVAVFDDIQLLAGLIGRPVSGAKLTS